MGITFLIMPIYSQYFTLEHISAIRGGLDTFFVSDNWIQLVPLPYMGHVSCTFLVGNFSREDDQKRLKTSDIRRLVGVICY